MKSVLLALKRIIVALAIFVLIFSVLFLIVFSFSPLKTFQFLRVMSGSMEPGIKTGSVVFVKEVNPKELKIGDIITFSVNGPISPVSHRIVKIVQVGNNLKFITKGDANRTNDIDEISQSSIKGKVLFTVPYIGYISAWTKTPLGFLLLIILPALLIIINEIFNIKHTVKDEIKKRVSEAKSPIILFIFLLTGVISLMFIKQTSAYFSDGKILLGNTFSTGHWLTPTPTPSVSPTPTATPTPTPTGTPTPTSTPPCNSSITIINNGSIENNILSIANTGGNITNTGSGSATVTTGNATSTVIVNNSINTGIINCH